MNDLENKAHASVARTSSRGFTLIEVLIVISLIGVLMLVTFQSGIFEAGDEGKIGLAQTKVKAMMGKIDQYRLRTEGEFPASIDDLLKPVGSSKSPVVAQQDELLDPWKLKLNYAFPATRSKYKYDLWSSGPDKQSGTPDDIGNWDTN